MSLHQVSVETEEAASKPESGFAKRVSSDNIKTLLASGSKECMGGLQDTISFNYVSRRQETKLPGDGQAMK